jgi:O-antigen/teichoic acid export membrane protein/glycosyltransferase involved in cell wall biosynthesis
MGEQSPDSAEDATSANADGADRARDLPAARLVFLVNAPGFGGGEQHALNLASAAHERGCAVLVVAPPGAPILARLAERGIPHRALRLGTNIGRWRGWLGTLLFVNPLAWIWFAWRLRQLAREAPSIFVCPFPREQMLVSWLDARRGPRVIWIVHSPFTYLPHRMLIAPLWRRLARRAGAVVAVAPRLARDLAPGLAATGVPRERLVVIPNAVPLPTSDATADLLRDPDLIAVASRLTALKGVQHLIAAMPAVLARAPGARLAIAGAGNFEPALRAQTRQLHLDGAVRFLGFVAEPADLLRMAGLCVYPSAEPRETLPTTILEAYALGVPVIATATGGIPDIVEHERTGLLVPPGDPAALADAITALLADGARARRLAAAGREFVGERYALDRGAATFLRLAASLEPAAMPATGITVATPSPLPLHIAAASPPPAPYAVAAPPAPPPHSAASAAFPTPPPHAGEGAGGRGSAWEHTPPIRPAPKSMPLSWLLAGLTSSFKGSGLIRNTTLLLTSKVITALATAWWTILAARVLPAAGYGNLMLGASLVELAAIVADAGVTAVGTREAARAEGERLRQLTGTLIYLKLGLGVVASGLLVVVALVIPFGAGVAPLLFVFAPSLVFISLNTLTLIPRARMRLLTVLTIALLASALGGGLALLAYFAAPTALGFALARVAGLLVTGVIALWVVARRYRPRLAFDPRLAWSLLVASAALGVSLALNIAYYRIDVPLLALLTNAPQVAIYTSAYRLLDVVTLLPASAAGVALPLMAALYKRERLVAFAQEYLELAVACGLFCAVLLTLVGQPLLRVLYAGRYDASWPVLAVLAWAGAATFLTNVFSPLAVGLNQRSALLTATLGGLVANVGLNLLLIPRLGAIGPAYATLATELIVTAPLVWTTLRALRWRVRLPRLLLAGLAAAASLLAGAALAMLGAPWWLGAFAACAIWAPTLARIAWSEIAGLREDWRVVSAPLPAVVVPARAGTRPPPTSPLPQAGGRP